MSDQVACEGVHAVVRTQPSSLARAPLDLSAQPVQAKTQFAVWAQPIAQVRALIADCAPLATPAGTQSSELAADWDERDTSTLLKLSTM